MRRQPIFEAGAEQSIDVSKLGQHASVVLKDYAKALTEIDDIGSENEALHLVGNLADLAGELSTLCHNYLVKARRGDLPSSVLDSLKLGAKSYSKTHSMMRGPIEGAADPSP